MHASYLPAGKYIRSYKTSSLPRDCIKREVGNPNIARFLGAWRGFDIFYLFSAGKGENDNKENIKVFLKWLKYNENQQY